MDVLQTAYRDRRAVVLFTAWRSVGSFPAAFGTVLLSIPSRLRALPLNMEVGFGPFTTVDSVALSHPRLPAHRVARARNFARVYRRNRPSTSFPRDLINSDWDYALQRLGGNALNLVLGIDSFVSVDSINTSGDIVVGTRPVIGQRAKRDEPRRPRLVGLRPRALTDASVRRLCGSELLLLNLHSAKGPKSSELVRQAMILRTPGAPLVLLAENASELVRFLSAAPFDVPLGAHACAEYPRQVILESRGVGRTRPQWEQEFRFALPKEGLSEREEDLARLARAAWRTQWRSLTMGEPERTPKFRFLTELSRLRRSELSSGDRFALMAQLLSRVENEVAATARERLTAVVSAVKSELSRNAARIQVIVGNGFEQQFVSSEVARLTEGTSVTVGTARHLADAAQLADTCLVCGYYGPMTLDACLRARAQKVIWVLDPIEAAAAAFEAHKQAALLGRLGFADAEHLLGVLDQTLFTASGGLRMGDPDDHAQMFSRLPTSRAADFRSAPDVEVIDEGADTLLLLDDGVLLQTSPSRRFDVVRPGAPLPKTVSASELNEGDQILLVRGTYQRTLSELLLEDMDQKELHKQAGLRRTWSAMVRSVVEQQRLSAMGIVQRVRQSGGSATIERVKSWLRDAPEMTTPRDWPTFLAFARALGIQLPDEAIREFFDAIRTWRVGHRWRGREVMRLLRLAWFGGLSAADLARTEQRWGLGVRDLIEGSRVVEVEAVRRLDVEEKL